MVPAAKNQKWLLHPEGCGCLSCKSRPREEEAKSLGTGESESATLEAAPTGLDLTNPVEIIETTAVYEVPAPIQVESVKASAEVTPKYPRDPRFPRRGELSLEEEQKGLVAKGHIAQYLYFRAIDPDITLKEVAERLDISVSALKKHLTKARKEGWLHFEDPLERIEFEVVPKVVDNLIHFLDMQDKQVTLETAKGTVFKQYQESKGITENSMTVLALKIEQPTDGEPKVVAGTVVGRGRILEES